MDNEFLASLRRLSDDALVASLKDLASRERVATSALVAHPAELDTRDIQDEAKVFLATPNSFWNDPRFRSASRSSR